MTSKKKHTVAILGAGYRGQAHLTAFQTNANRFEIVGVCDQVEGRMQHLKTRCPDAGAYQDADRMLAETKPDVFCFGTLPHIRLPLIELGVKHGVKAIAYEKPMATSLAEARRIRDICDEAGVKTVVSHQHKYGPHWQKVREIAASGDIGEVHTIHATAKGWLLQYATHLADYMMFLAGGSRIKWVVGHVQGREKLTDSHPSPDYAVGHFEFENGVRGIMECGEHAPDLPGDNSFWLDAGAIVHGSEGYAQAIVGTGWRASTKSSNGLISGPGQYDDSVDMPPYISDLADWLDDPKKVHPCNGDVSYHGFQLAMAICLSSLEKRTVTLPIETDTDIIARLNEEL